MHAILVVAVFVETDMRSTCFDAVCTPVSVVAGISEPAAQVPDIWSEVFGYSACIIGIARVTCKDWLSGQSIVRCDRTLLFSLLFVMLCLSGMFSAKSGQQAQSRKLSAR